MLKEWNGKVVIIKLKESGNTLQLDEIDPMSTSADTYYVGALLGKDKEFVYLDTNEDDIPDVAVSLSSIAFITTDVSILQQDLGTEMDSKILSEEMN